LSKACRDAAADETDYEIISKYDETKKLVDSCLYCFGAAGAFLKVGIVAVVVFFAYMF